MTWKKWLAVILVLFVVLLLTPFDEILFAAAFALGGVLAVVVLAIVLILLIFILARRTAWGRGKWAAAERKVDRLLR